MNKTRLIMTLAAVLLVLSVGVAAVRAEAMDAPEYCAECGEVDLCLLLRSAVERQALYGKAEDELDGLIAEARVPSVAAEPEREYLGRFWVTGYDLCVHCCGIWSAEHPSRIGTGYVQTTASGVPNQVGVTVAAGLEFPFGTVLYIEGVGERTVQDRGVGNGCLDVLCHDHAGCAEVTGWRDVWRVR